MGESGRYTVYNEIVAEPLSKENHEEWFKCVRNYLIARELWKVTNGRGARPGKYRVKDYARWRRKNAAALHVILISCGPHYFSRIKGVSEAKDAWRILNHTVNPPKPEQVIQDQIDFDKTVLYKAICDEKWLDARAFLYEHPSALTTKITFGGDTALHVAAQFGHVDIVKELVKLVPSDRLEILEITNDYGFTPLATAARYNSGTRIAEYIVNRNSDTLGISTKKYLLPVTLAFQRRGGKEMQRYLYSVTPLKYLKPERAEGPKLLRSCLTAGDLDIALHLLERCEELLTFDTKSGPIMQLAAMSSTFSSRSQLVVWKRWIYDYIRQNDEDERVPGLGLPRKFISNANNLLGMKEIYERKLQQARATQILSLFCKNVPSLITKNPEATNVLLEALFHATKEGNIEFVVQISKAYPQLILLNSKTGWNTFFYAVKYRQAEIFNLIHGLRFKDSLTSNIAPGRSTLLHVAGELAPSFQLNRISGPALQMQRELQWFKEVENVVPSRFKRQQNSDGMQPEDIFKEHHKDLRKEGEKWMKGTASSCSVVSALIVTIMFAVAFTVPGGNSQDFGYPIFLKRKLFVIFIFSDALSMFSSSVSVFIFLGILTSRYAEEDFLESLPRKLITGLSALFLSITTMMIAFSSCILIMLQHTYSWSFLPVIMLASVPVTLFVLSQFRLLVQMISCTYGQGIFNRNEKPWP